MGCCQSILDKSLIKVQKFNFIIYFYINIILRCVGLSFGFICSKSEQFLYTYPYIYIYHFRIALYIDMLYVSFVLCCLHAHFDLFYCFTVLFFIYLVLVIPLFTHTYTQTFDFSAVAYVCACSVILPLARFH